ncbi:MAG: ABC transporter substrate-binding protein [Candidatus Limnocylindrales bacterium]
MGHIRYRTRQEGTRRFAVPGLLLALGMLAAGCAVRAGDATDVEPGPATVSVLGTWTGPELDAFRGVVAPFEAATGITVAYARTTDLAGEIDRRIAIGDPPDLAGLAGPAHMERLAQAGVLRDLGASTELDGYLRETAPAFVRLGMVDERLVGAIVKTTLKGLVWHGRAAAHLGEPDGWDDLVRTAARFSTDDTRAWCVGLGSPGAAGWPGTDWIENILLRQSGTRIWDAWVDGSLPWTAPEIRMAFAAYLDVVSPGSVAGGTYGALTTDALAAGDGLFGTPPRCLYTQSASFQPALFDAQGRDPGDDYDFFPMPDFDGGHSGAVEVAGDLVGLFTDRPAAIRLLAWLTGVEAQRAWVATGGGLSANARVTEYPDRLTQREAAVLTGASQVRFDASDQMPAPIEAAFRRAVMDVTAAPERLDEVLADLEAFSAPSGRGPRS